MIRLWFSRNGKRLHVGGWDDTAPCGAGTAWGQDDYRDVPESWMEDPGAHNICKTCARRWRVVRKKEIAKNQC